MTKRLAGLGVVLWLVAGVLGRPVTAVEPQRHFLWRVSSPSTAIYLLGSIHVLEPDEDVLAGPAASAFAAARNVVFEVDMDRMGEAGTKLLAAGTLPTGTCLADVVAPDTYRLARERLQGLGLDPESFTRMRPWMAAIALSSVELAHAGYSQEDGVDARLFALAGEAGKKRLALETVDFQVGLFAHMARGEDEAFLRETLRELDALIPQVKELTAAWRRGDVPAVSRLLREGYEEYPDLFACLVTARNRTWLPRLEELLGEGEPSLVVVGALHLLGDGGVIDLLRRRGYTVQQM